MKQIITIMIALILVSPVFAIQPDHKGHRSLEERAEGKLQFLTIVLDLTDAQLSDIRSLQSDHISSINGIKSQYQTVLDNMKEDLKAVRLENESTFAEAREKAKAVREQYKPQLEPMHNALKEEKNAFDEVLVKIFSNEQNEKYFALKTLKEEMKSQKQPRHHPHDK